MIFAAEQLRDLIDLAVLLSLPGVLVLAWLVGRLLGVRRSWTTTLLSGVIGWGRRRRVVARDREPAQGHVRGVHAQRVAVLDPRGHVGVGLDQIGRAHV